MKRCQQQSGKTEIRGALTQAETLTTKVQHGPAWGIGRTGTSATIRKEKSKKMRGKKIAQNVIRTQTKSRHKMYYTGLL